MIPSISSQFYGASAKYFAAILLFHVSISCHERLKLPCKMHPLEIVVERLLV